MACQGCKDPEKPHVATQHAINFKAWYVGGQTFQGCCEAWKDLPEDGCLAVKVFFNDGTARNCNGNDWYGMLKVNGFWTIIHNDNTDNAVRYPDVIFKRGMWVPEPELVAVFDDMNRTHSL